MKLSILEIVVALIFSALLYIAFLKYHVLRFYRKYNIEMTNIAALVYIVSLNVVFVLTYTALPEPIINSYGIIKMNATTSQGLWSTFLPLLGQYLVLLFATYFVAVFMCRYLFKLLINSEGIHLSISIEERTQLILFFILIVAIAIIGRYFIIQIAQQMIPLSNSIF